MSRYSEAWKPYESAMALAPAPKRDKGKEGTADLLRMLGSAAAPVGTAIGSGLGAIIGGGATGGIGAAPGAGIGGAIGGALGSGLGALAGYGAEQQTRDVDEAELERQARRQMLMQVLGGMR